MQQICRDNHLIRIFPYDPVWKRVGLQYLSKIHGSMSPASLIALLADIYNKNKDRQRMKSRYRPSLMSSLSSVK